MQMDSKKNTGNRHWYDKLDAYFPDHELKDREQLEDLIEQKEGYKKVETDDYLLLYAEFPTFVFIDYFLVSPKSRGKGIGSKVLDRLKKKGKLILLEAEPRDEDDRDTERRLNFYKKNGFRRADRIEYRREGENGEVFTLDILYWPPGEESQKSIYEKMKKACSEIHNFRSSRYYGKPPADPEEALDFKS